ncbi:AMP-binding protein [Streptomyces sp. K1PA1]|uniref:AMP-binding protein n=1 Tax=Streptomyces tropicalis TaxID=3034234 RepID=A0ABT6A3P7_9ACTN|nr:AMP-binding protein [Streptomyces tropicalis]
MGPRQVRGVHARRAREGRSGAGPGWRCGGGAAGPAYRYLVTGDADGEVRELSYARLARRSRAVAARLQERGLTGSRALLLYPPGLEFVPAFLGCLAAGVVAVPGVPPQGRARNHRALIRTQRLPADSDARVVLGDRRVLDAPDASAHRIPELDGVARIATEDVDDAEADAWCEPDLTADSVAFLQYASGSTAAPRGVMVTHGNLLDNERIVTERMGHSPEAMESHDLEMFVSRLPVYHDPPRSDVRTAGGRPGTAPGGTARTGSTPSTARPTRFVRSTGTGCGPPRRGGRAARPGRPQVRAPSPSAAADPRTRRPSHAPRSPAGAPPWTCSGTSWLPRRTPVTDGPAADYRTRQ